MSRGGKKEWNNSAYSKRAKDLSLECGVTAPFSRDAAMELLSVLQTYVSEHPDQFDLKFANEFDKVRLITNGTWTPTLSNSFEAFNSYLAGFPDLQKYLEDINVAEAKAMQQRVEQLRNSILQDMEMLKAWAGRNVLDEKAAEVAKLDLQLGKAGAQGVNALQKLSAEVQRLVFATGMRDDPEKNMCSQNNTASCSDTQLCEKATYLMDGNTKWQSNVFEKHAKSIGLLCDVREIFTKDEAMLYLVRLTAFIQSGGNIFDLKFATEFNKVRPITDGVWSSTLSADFESFRLYLDEFFAFKNYLDELESAEYAQKQLRFEQLRGAAAENMAILREWAKLNVLDVKAAEIAQLDSDLGNSSLQDGTSLDKLLAEANRLMTATGIKDGPMSGKAKGLISSLYEPSSFYIFVNLSGSQANVYTGMDGKSKFEQNNGLYCPTKKLGAFDYYLLRDRIFETFEGLSSVDQYCSQKTDIFVIKGNELTTDRVFDVMPLSGLTQVSKFSKADRDKAYDQLTFLKEAIQKDVLDGTRIGFGILKAGQAASKVCAIINGDEYGHQEQLDQHTLLLKALNLQWTGFEKMTSSSE